MERIDGNGTGIARCANGQAGNENGNVFLTATVCWFVSIMNAYEMF
jgi:hypothetical protein